MSKKKNRNKWIVSSIAALFAVCTLPVIVEEPIGGIIMFLIFAAIAFFVCPATQNLRKKKESVAEPVAKKSDTYDFLPPKQTFLGPAELPGQKNGIPEAYRYLIPFVSKNEAVVLSAADHDWRLTACDKNGEIHLYSGETAVGVLDHPKSKMIQDWMKNGEPYEIIVRTHNAENEFQLLLVFYRDKAAHYQNRQQEVVTLVSYKSEAKQDIISSLDHGDEVKLDNDYELSGRGGVYVTYHGEAIGKLPAKSARRFDEDGAACALIEEIKEECNKDYETIYIPVIRIYW